MSLRGLLVAAENAVFHNAKVGGMADVIRDLPHALNEQGLVLDCVMPDYGFLVSDSKAKRITSFQVAFRQQRLNINLYRTENPSQKGCWIYLFEHPLFDTQSIYTDSGSRPFADDANKFALFCLCVAEALKQERIPIPDIVHLHDWHAALFALLRSFIKEFQCLQSIPTVFTIHNLALQGIRPLQSDDSSLEAWYPNYFLQLTDKAITQILDPRYGNCINLMRTAINLSDRVHVVSPTYAREVLQTSDPDQGFFGGEGLEHDLKARGRSLIGILNGCFYPKTDSAEQRNFQDLVSMGQQSLMRWHGSQEVIRAEDYILESRLKKLADDAVEPDFILTSVGRMTEQKMLILTQNLSDGRTALEGILDSINNFSETALLVVIGSGNPTLAGFFREHASRYANLLYFNGYDEHLPNWLYRHGDLFLMPSSFEPCGISQMLAMREGQPCLVHGVGGLKDTVAHDVSGFVFEAEGLETQANELLNVLQHALALFGTPQWNKIKRSAKTRRFSWQRSGKQMAQRLYQLHKLG